jgi:beta-glucuronidase
MRRIFKEHRIRNSIGLDGDWEYSLIDGPALRKGVKIPRKINVPSVWEKIPGLETWRGRASFSRRIKPARGRFTRIVFGGVSHTGRVFADGKVIGSHHNAYSEWSVLLPPGQKSNVKLVVEVDNSYGASSALHRPENDFYTYGGITRPVELQEVPAVFIERMKLVPVRRGKRWAIEASVTLRNAGADRQKRDLSLTVAGREVRWNAIWIAPDSVKTVTAGLNGLNVREWSPRTPRLYSANAVLSDESGPVDDLIDRIGFREVQVKGEHIRLNGKRIFLKGFNRHEDHGDYGCAIPLKAMNRDLDLMKDLGCNCVRTSHYQNDTRFIDLCDERGVLVWDESLAWQTPFTHPAFLEQTLACTREMVEQHANHPSIVIWGALNECDTKTALGRSVHKKVLGLIRKLDPSRPVTYAGNHGKGDTCLGFCDIVSWNRYDAWYHGGIPRIAPELEDMLDWLDSKKSRGGAGKPVILSEFGAAGLYGNRQATRQRWSEEYQSEVLDASLGTYLTHPRLSGALIWQFCDCRVNEGGWFNRPRCYNNKGVLDEFRRPKLCYDAVKKRMRGKKG